MKIWVAQRQKIVREEYRIGCKVARVIVDDCILYGMTQLDAESMFKRWLARHELSAQMNRALGDYLDGLARILVPF